MMKPYMGALKRVAEDLREIGPSEILEPYREWASFYVEMKDWAPPGVRVKKILFLSLVFGEMLGDKVETSEINEALRESAVTAYSKFGVINDAAALWAIERLFERFNLT